MRLTRSSLTMNPHRRAASVEEEADDIWRRMDQRRRTNDGEQDALSMVVMGAGTTRFHRADCEMVAGRNWPSVTRQEALDEVRRPCGMCRP
jgi:hypothetical protein